MEWSHREVGAVVQVVAAWGDGGGGGSPVVMVGVSGKGCS